MIYDALSMAIGKIIIWEGALALAIFVAALVGTCLQEFRIMVLTVRIDSFHFSMFRYGIAFVFWRHTEKRWLDRIHTAKHIVLLERKPFYILIGRIHT